MYISIMTTLQEEGREGKGRGKGEEREREREREECVCVRERSKLTFHLYAMSVCQIEDIISNLSLDFMPHSTAVSEHHIYSEHKEHQQK